MLIKIYRISDKGNQKTKVNFATKMNCLKNFIQEFGKDNLFIVADNCSEVTINELNKLDLSILKTNLGNSGSFIYAVKFVIHSFKDNDYVYFIEDDYIHLSKSLDIIYEGLSIADYVTLYDHPDKYHKSEKSIVLVTESAHWQTICSTTMTFATKVIVMREDFWIFKNLSLKKGPKDFLIFPIISNRTPVYQFHSSFFKKVMTLITHYILVMLRLILFNKTRVIISCIPGYSTHSEIEYLSPFIDWETQIK